MKFVQAWMVCPWMVRTQLISRPSFSMAVCPSQILKKEVLFLKHNSLLFSLFFTLLKTLLEWGGGDMEGKAQSPGSLTGSSSLLPGQPAQQESCIHLTSFTPWVPHLSLKEQELSWCASTHRYLTDALGRISMEMGSTFYLSPSYFMTCIPFSDLFSLLSISLLATERTPAEAS